MRVKIIIENLAQKEVVSNNSGKTVLHHLQENYVDWLQSCGGKGRCTSCKMIIVEGAENLSPPTLSEDNYRRQGLLKDNERLACQSKVTGNLRVIVPEETKLKHLSYSS